MERALCAALLRQAAFTQVDCVLFRTAPGYIGWFARDISGFCSTPRLFANSSSYIVRGVTPRQRPHQRRGQRSVARFPPCACNVTTRYSLTVVPLRYNNAMNARTCTTSRRLARRITRMRFSPSVFAVVVTCNARWLVLFERARVFAPSPSTEQYQVSLRQFLPAPFAAFLLTTGITAPDGLYTARHP